MRARQRHFNPKDAGAVAAYDSRFISGINNGDAISQWNSRTGTNNVTQATVARQPRYDTNQLNGNPSVSFDGGDRLIFPSGILSSNFTAIVLGKTDGGSAFVQEFITQGNGTTGHCFMAAVAGGPNWGCYTIGGGWKQSASNVNQTFKICTLIMNGTGVFDFFTNGTQENQTSNASSFLANSGPYYIGDDPYNQTLNGDITFISLNNSSLGNSLRRRIEHSAAYSFKNSCS